MSKLIRAALAAAGAIGLAGAVYAIASTGHVERTQIPIYCGPPPAVP